MRALHSNDEPRGHATVGPTGAYSTIGSAISDAEDGDVVLVQAGTYTEDIDIRSKTNMTLRGEGVDVTNLTGGAGTALIYVANSTTVCGSRTLPSTPGTHERVFVCWMERTARCPT